MTGKDRSVIDLLRELVNSGAVVSSELTQRLSEPLEEDYAEFTEYFPKLPVETRRRLLGWLGEVIENDYLLDFSQIGHFAINDEDSHVRSSALDCLWFDLTLPTLTLIRHTLLNDTNSRVRAAAALSLGRYILSGVMDEFPQEHLAPIMHDLINLYSEKNEDTLVRRRILESLAYSENNSVPGFILEAYDSNNQDFRASAVAAMGRHGDETLWGGYILRALFDADESIRFEAVHAAGEMGLQEALSTIISLTKDPDPEISTEAVWALGEIGGHEAVKCLTDLLESTDTPELVELIEDSIAMAMLMSNDSNAILPGSLK